jgi:hypothetical protein
MRFRRWVGWLAFAAIMLHTVTVARHNVILFQAIPNELAVLAGFEPGAICHVDSEADKDGKTPGFPGDRQNSSSKPCPICQGFASVHALQTSETAYCRITQAVSLSVALPEEPDIAPSARVFLPLTHGPPSLA